MNKIFLAFCLLITTSVLAFAQTDYKKSEFFIGYSNNQVDTLANSGSSIKSFFRDRASFNGVEVSGVANLSRYVGIKGDVSATYKNQHVNAPFTFAAATGTVGFDSTRAVYNVLGGVQFKDNSSDAKVKLFAHALVGAGHTRYNAKNLSCTVPVSSCPSFVLKGSDTGFAGAFGGGIDIKAGDKIDFRALQVDYNPMRLNNITLHNVRFGIGIVIK